MSEIDVLIRVANINRAPVIDEGFHAFIIGEDKRFVIAASDPDAGDTLAYSAQGLPEGATLDPVDRRVQLDAGTGPERRLRRRA